MSDALRDIVEELRAAAGGYPPLPQGAVSGWTAQELEVLGINDTDQLIERIDAELAVATRAQT